MNTGIWQAIGANVIWGVLPVYWKALQHVPAEQILGYRIVLSFLSLVCVISLTRRWKDFRETALKPRVLRTYAVAAVLIGISWFTFVWAVNAGFIVETSLGYFISPLLNVAMGVIFLRERMRPWQWLPIGLVAVGVLYLTISGGSFPWVALSLGALFTASGVIRRQIAVGAMPGLFIETAMLLPFAAGWIGWLVLQGEAAISEGSAGLAALLVAGGPITVVPLLCFAVAAKRVSLTTIGFLQFLAPTLQFLVGVYYGEPLTPARVVCFVCIWTAVLVFSFDALRVGRKKPLPA